MAERRMIAKTIIDSDAFLEMPQSTQLLYFHLAMRGDDDGFINKPKAIMQMVGGKDDDIKILIAKKFIIPFESGVVVIKHWKIHNYIQNDRYRETKYKEEKSLLELDENKAYKLSQTVEIQPCIQSVSKMETQDRLEIGKDRIGKDIYIPPDGSKSVKQIKRKYGEYDNVKLTDDEFEKLNSEYGNEPTKRAIEYLSCYREEKGYKNRSDYLAMKRWVYDASKKNQSSNPFKEALRKELEDERQRSESNHVGYQGGLSKLLQEPDGD